MADLHIEEFCQDTVRILLRLYRSFPRPAVLYVEDISGPDQPDECGLHAPRFSACFGAMLWLEQENYLRYGATIRQEAIEEAVLTRKSLALLCAPEPLSPEGEAGNNAAALRRILQHGSSTQLAEKVQQLLLSTPSH